MEYFPVIVCIAKKEHDYIEEFVKYHLAIGFKRIYLYDNEDQPTYQNLLNGYKDNIVVTHLPFNNYKKPVQYVALDNFVKNYLYSYPITHAIHIDIDEFIVLKKHDNICDFIKEYFDGNTCAIGINWRFFGSSGKKEKTNEPVTQRFTMRQNNFDQHIKTLFEKKYFDKYNTCHDVKLKRGKVKSTNGLIIDGPFCPKGDISVIQLNHYKCKTLPEFRYIRTRQRADIIGNINENVDESFNHYDRNEEEDLYARDFYKKHCMQ